MVNYFSTIIVNAYNMEFVSKLNGKVLCAKVERLCHAIQFMRQKAESNKTTKDWKKV